MLFVEPVRDIGEVSGGYGDIIRYCGPWCDVLDGDVDEEHDGEDYCPEYGNCASAPLAGFGFGLFPCSYEVPDHVGDVYGKQDCDGCQDVSGSNDE